MNKKQKSFLLGLVLYLLSTSVSYGAFNYFRSAPSPVLPTDESGGLLIDPGAPRDQECPINGQMFTKVERDSWEQRRPLIIMVENSAEARPHSGIVKADAVYEAVAEGGVTRFMPVYYCAAQANDVKVAPVRSVRTYFIDWASEYGETPLFGHVGGANCSAEKIGTGYGPCKTDKRAQAIEQLVAYEWRWGKGNDLDQFSVGAPTYIRDETRLGHRVATEHSVVGSTELLWSEGLERGWSNQDLEGEEWSDNFTPWEFADEAAEADRGNISNIEYAFWDGYSDYSPSWSYDRASNTYLRSTGGEAHKDLETGDQLFAKNVVVMFTNEIGPVDELKHMLYTTIGSGEALIFQNGEVIEATWSKSTRTGRTTFEDSSGDEIPFVRGLIWISVVATNTEVSY